MTRRTSLKLTDERERQLERTSKLIAADQHNELPMSVVIDAALQYLLESKENVDDARGEYDPGRSRGLRIRPLLGFDIGRLSKVSSNGDLELVEIQYAI